MPLDLAEGVTDLHDEAVRLITSNIAPSTRRQYASQLRHWEKWCAAIGEIPTDTSIAHIVNFLADFHARGASANSVGIVRSAISRVHRRVDGGPIGSHPLVAKAMMGMRLTRPAVPRQVVTWKVDDVFRVLTSGSLASDIDCPLHVLVTKLAFLVLVCTAYISVERSS